MALDGVVQGADEVFLVQQRKQPRRFVDGDNLHIEPEIAASRDGELEEVHSLRRAGEVDPAGNMNAAGLSRGSFEFLVQLDRVLLKFGDVWIAVQRMHTPRGMPRRARSQFIALD